MFLQIDIFICTTHCANLPVAKQVKEMIQIGHASTLTILPSDAPSHSSVLGHSVIHLSCSEIIPFH